MAEHGSDDELAELGELVDTMESLVEADASVARGDGGRPRASTTSSRGRASNRVMAAVSRDIREVIGTLWGFSNLDDADVEHVAAQHRQIADAMLAPRRTGRRRGDARPPDAGPRAPICTALGETAELRSTTATVAE